jgi:hypothetical protein
MNKITYESTLSELQAEVATKQAEAVKAADKVTKFVEIFGDGSSASAAPAAAPKGKPGRKPKAATEDATSTPEPVKPKGKPGRKPKAKDESAADPKPKVAGMSRAAEGRRQVANGDRPKLHDAMAVTAGDRIVNADTLFTEMKEMGWLPFSDNPRGYISYTLSSAKETFEKVPAKGRGFYRVVSSYEAPPALVAQKLAKGSSPKAAVEPVKASSDEDKKAESEVKAAPVEDEAPATTPKASVVKRKSTDDVLKDAGLELGGPFGG